MQTWDIAKLLLANCESADDVDSILQILNDLNSTRDICSRLQGFSTHHSSVVGQGSSQRDESSGPPLSLNPKGLGVASEIAQAYQLETLLRASGKTNKHIEQWITETFQIKRNIGKGSLRLYLARVLDAADLSSRNRILSAAHKLVSKDRTANTDIIEFWDQLDKRFATSDE